MKDLPPVRPVEHYDITWPWIVVAAVCLVAAMWQWAEVASRLSHCAVMVWKFGFEKPLISAGSTMVGVFFIASAGFIGLGGTAVMALRSENSRWRHWADASVAMLIGGGIVWGSLVLSPLVTVLPR